MPLHADNDDGHHHNGVAPPPPKPNQKFVSLILKAIIMTTITTVFFLFLGVAAILLLLATAAVHRHSSSTGDENQIPHGRSKNGLSSKDIKKLPLPFKFSSLKTTTTTKEPQMMQQSSCDQCVVCLDSIREGQWCRRLVGCGHIFHRKCVDAWLVKVSTCPICRTHVRLVVPEEQEEEEDGDLRRRILVRGLDWMNDSRVW